MSTDTMACALRQALDTHARADRVAYRTDDVAVGYAELRAAVHTRAAAATEAGLTGKFVGLLTGKTPDSIATFLGLIVAGACPGFLDPRLSDEQVGEQAEAVGMGIVIAPDDRAQRLTTVPRVLRIADLDSPRDPDSVPEPSAEDAALILFTSGSTGRPKGVVLSQSNLLVNSRGIVERTQLTASDRLLHLMPLHHTNGVNNQILAPLLAGSTVTLVDRFRPADAVEAIRKHQPTIVTGVPTMYLRMLEYLRPGESFPELRFLRCGSAPITPAQQDAVEQAFGVPVVLSYGMSEATCTSTMNPVGHPRRGSVGTVLPGQHVRIVRPGSLTSLPDGDEGEVVIGGGAVMTGYIGTDTSSPIEDGWLRTGDLGRLDDGYLTITGRLKDTIIRGGENISPATIEHVLVEHPAVQDCCVVGQPHDDLGEVPVAFISLTPGAVEPPQNELRTWVESRLSRMFVPAELRLLTQLPVNRVGKIDRTELKRAALQPTS